MAVKLKIIASMLLVAPVLWGCNGKDNNDEPGATVTASQPKTDTTLPPAAGDNGAEVPVPPVAGDTGSNDASTASGFDFFASGNMVYAINRTDNAPTPVVVDQLSTTANANINAGYVENFKNYHWLFSTVDFGSEGASNIQAAALLYVNGQNFKKVLANGATLSGASVVSSESQANRMCEATQPNALRSAISKAELKYQLPGNDGICNTADDVYRKVNVNMSANDAPQTISAIEFGAIDILDSSDTVKWHLSQNNGKLTRYSDVMSNPATLWDGVDLGWTKVNQLQVALVSLSADGAHSVLQLDVSGIKNGATTKEQLLYVLDNTSGNLSPLIYIASLTKPAGKLFASGFELIGNQGGQQYFSVNDSEVIRFPDAGGTAATVVNGISGVVGLTSTHLVFTSVAAGQTSLKAKELASVSGPATLKFDANLSGYAVSRDRLYYQIGGSAGSIKFDGTDDVVFNNAKWVGYGVNNNIRTATALPNASSLLLAQNISLDSNGNWSGGTLAAVSASSGQIVSNLGAAPAQVSRYSFVSVDYSGALLGYGYSSDGKLQYLLSANQAGQVVKVATDLSRIGWLTDWISGR